MLAVMPNKEVLFEDEIKNFDFSEKSSRQLARVIGLGSRRLADEGVTASDLCIHGINYLLEQNLLAKEEIAAIIFISRMPDYISPPTSNVIQGKLGLGHDVVCIDLNQTCAGFVLGLFEGFCLLNPLGERGKVILLNAQAGSTYITSKRDRSTAPLFGDAAVITIMEKVKKDTITRFKIKNDGARYDAIITPAGGFRLRCSEKTHIEEPQSDGNYRSMEQVWMKGEDVYNFTVNEAVDLINEAIEDSGFSRDEIDYFMFHQPNQFIVKNMIKKLKLPEEKAPVNIFGRFGNSSGATLPVSIVYNLGNLLENKTLKLILSGFGGGLAWNTAAIEMGNMKFCKMIGHPVI